jgi:phosphohistidine swiveling domain-containing protein
VHLLLNDLRRRLGVPDGVVLAPIVGRQLGDASLEELARLLDGLDPDQTMQVVHVDDVTRLVRAIGAGTLDDRVSLAAPGRVPVTAVAGALGLAPPRGTERAAVIEHRAPGFVLAWTAAAAVEDLSLAAFGTTRRRGRIRRRPGRARFRLELLPPHTPPADDAPLAAATPEHARGELDTPVDPRFPVYSSVNLTEALPGPATPLSLTTVGRGTRAATLAFIDLVPIGGVLETEARARGQGVIGHRPYVNLSYAIALARITPGMDVDAMAEQFVGRGAVEELTGAALPGGGPGRLRMAVVAWTMARRMAGMLRSLRAESAFYVAAVQRLRVAASDPNGLADEQLQALAALAADLVVTGWFLGGRNVLAVQVYGSAASRLAGSPLGPVGDEQSPLASAATLLGVRSLAAAARADDAALAVLRTGGDGLAARVGRASPAFGRRLDEALAAFGHRAPAECELANPTFADDPDLLLRAVARVVDAPVPPSVPTQPVGARGARARLARRVRRREGRVQLLREHTRDHLVRNTDVLRRLALEQGGRLVARDVLDDATDVFYLTADELFVPPVDARAIVARRRAEQHRLTAVRLPPIVSGAWSDASAEPTLTAGESLHGLGASPGTAKGRVRIVTPDRLDEVNPGDVLVANVTDVGYTFAFAYAAAVVTDVGGVMSHAAVVAREFGIPAVVDTANATERLADGMLVAVDGTRGEITVVEEREVT